MLYNLLVALSTCIKLSHVTIKGVYKHRKVISLYIVK